MSIIENAFDKDNARSNNKISSSVRKCAESTSHSVGYQPLGADVKQTPTVNNVNVQVGNDPYRPVEEPENQPSQPQVRQPMARQEGSISTKEAKPSKISALINRSRSLLKRNDAVDNSIEQTHHHTRESNTYETRKNFNQFDNHQRRAPGASDKQLYIDSDLLKQKGMVSHSDDFANPVITNEYRIIKHRVLNTIHQLSVDEVPYHNMLMVTSVNPSEGKTFSAINMAISISSEKNNTILLVDANIHNPGICTTLGIEAEVGLIDYLLGNVNDISEVIYNTNIPNLKILPVGAIHHLSNELLSSVKMQELASELSGRYSDRVVIFDCPPLLGVVETVTISKIMGQAIVVVEHLVTKFSDIERGISEIMDNLQTGFIVNKTIGGTYSQYGHGYEKKIPNS